MGGKEDIRYLALETLLAMEKNSRKGVSVTEAVLERYSYLDKTDRAFYTRLVRGTCENSIRDDMIIDTYSKVPSSAMKPAIRWILRMAVYQIEKMDSVPERAAVNEAVRLAGKKGFGRLKGFVNGVLRSFLREPDRFREPGKNEPALYLKAVYSMPEFLTERWAAKYGLDTAEKMCASFEGAGDLTVRIRKEKEETLASFEREGISFEKAPYVPDAYTITGIDRLTDLEAFENGNIYVQDVSSQLAVYAAGIEKGDTVLDVCAAPGGKSILAADLTGDKGKVISRDISAYKTALIEENAARCGVSNIIAEVHDAAEYDPSLHEKADCVIVDAPCSGYGVIGRKGDIIFSASEEKERSLSALQKRILDTSSRYVKKGGVLIYSTCTVNETENEDNVRRFLGEHPDFTPEEPGGIPAGTRGYIQLLPGIHGCDGFFIAKFRKH